MAGEPRVCTRGTDVRGALRCAVRGVAGLGKGARRALCPACVCKRGAGVQARGAGGPQHGEGALRASARRALGMWGAVGGGRTHPGSADEPPLRLRRGHWLGLPVPGRLPAARMHQR